MGGLQVLCYISISFSIVALSLKIAKIARMPVNLRWELYPVPHEKGKGHYGGSYLEEYEWWTKSTNYCMISELKEVAEEIIFFKSLFYNNRVLWIFSFPFHFGMYCLITFMFLIIFGVILAATGDEISVLSSNSLSVIVYYLTIILGTTGWILATLGAFGLFVYRLFWKEIRKSTGLSDYMNILFLLAVFVAGLISWLTVDPHYIHLRILIQSLITFKPVGILPTAVSIQIWILVALLFYFPFTPMTHLFGKYFTYHQIRWENSPNVRGGKIEKAVRSSLEFQQNWSASHIKTGGIWAGAETDEENKNG